MEIKELTQYIKAEAARLGFDVCGIARAGEVAPAQADALERWVQEGCHGTMSYLERNGDKRRNPAELVPGCKSIISVALGYAQESFDETHLHLSRYAQGDDYHKIVKDKLHLLLQSINSVHPVKGRPFCDSAPVMERYWAKEAGIGRIGKNHQLIIPRLGSYFFLGELLVDCELEYDKPLTESICGGCTRCIDNCPTGALTTHGFDARKCLSYLTIEHRGELPENLGEKMGKCIYGCDRCQTACPWNRGAQPCKEPAMRTNEGLAAMRDSDWHTLSEERYKELFAHSAVERAGYALLTRNIAAVKESEKKVSATE